MKLEDDYIKEFEENQKDLEKYIAPKRSLTEKEEHSLELLKQMGDADRSQYERTENKELRRMWEKVIYSYLCTVAKDQGGRVTLNISEDTLTGSLVYFGHELIINNLYCSTLNCFRLMLAYTDDFFISADDRLIELHFLFHIYDQKQVEDHTEEIRNLQKQLHTKSYFDRMFGKE